MPERSEYQKTRQAALEGLNQVLMSIQPRAMPRWLAYIAALPLLMALLAAHAGSATLTLIRVWAGLLLDFVLAPLAMLWLFVDLALLTAWAMDILVDRLSGE